MPDRVAFRDGPGTWAKNADWDEYWVSIENMSNGERSLLLFFPLSPSPRQLEITYVAGGNKRLLVVDTLAALDGLHSGTQQINGLYNTVREERPCSRSSGVINN
jgi:hypothetical protein